MKCDIIMPVWNQRALTVACVDSILKHTDVSYRLIIIDNASGPETAGYLQRLARERADVVTVIRNNDNLGFIKASNQGLSASTASYACLLNNDTVVTAGWLGAMIGVAEKEQAIGIVNPSSNNLGQRPQDGEPLDRYAARLAAEKGGWVELGAAVGFCMLIKREVIDRIGLLDEIYGMGNFEDTDFSRRAVQAGYYCVRACAAYVYHRENASFGKVKTFDDDFKRNREIFEFRWGRPKRVAYVIERVADETLRRIGIEALRLAREGNWVWFFSKDDLHIPRHSNIIMKKMESSFFRTRVLAKMVTKKKRFNEVYVGDERFARILEASAVFHKAKVAFYL